MSYVFISGPYQGKTHDATAYCDIETHINNARRWASRLARDRLPFFCPHLNSAHMEVMAPDVPAEFYYAMDLAILKHAAAILLIEGWENSKGACIERRFALDHQITVYRHEDYQHLVQEWRWVMGAGIPGRKGGEHDGVDKYPVGELDGLVTY